jgi:hypothetical protein
LLASRSALAASRLPSGITYHTGFPESLMIQKTFFIA